MVQQQALSSFISDTQHVPSTPMEAPTQQLYVMHIQVINLTMIYGILGLEQQFPGGRLSIAQLRQLCEKGGAQLVVERNLPGLQRQILNLQTNLDAVFDRLAVEVSTTALQEVQQMYYFDTSYRCRVECGVHCLANPPVACLSAPRHYCNPRLQHQLLQDQSTSSCQLCSSSSLQGFQQHAGCSLECSRGSSRSWSSHLEVRQWGPALQVH